MAKRKQLRKAEHLYNVRRRRQSLVDMERRQMIEVLLAKSAGATWAQIAEAVGLESRQHAYQRFAGWQTDGEYLWRQEAMTAKKSTARQARGTVS